MLKLILCILAAVVVVYLIVAFYKSDSEFIPLEDMTKKLKSAFLFIFATSLLLGCHKGSDVQRDLSSMSDAEKQTLLEEKFKESTFAGGDWGNEIKFIPTNTDESLYCLLANTYLLQYNIITDTWKFVGPFELDEDSNEPFPKYPFLMDYRLKGNHLYFMFNTGQCGLGLQSIAFEYFDLLEEKWHFITYGTESSEMVGDSIMADVAWITKEGVNGFDTEYEDSIRWIKME